MKLNKRKLINDLKVEFLKVVKNYKNDFYHDIKFINSYENESLEFLYQLRKNGTQLYYLEKINKNKLHDRIKFLFGYSTKLKIAENMAVCIKESFKENEENFYHVKNNEVKKIKRNDAILIYNEYLRLLRL
jgi:hypothetical protein